MKKECGGTQNEMVGFRYYLEKTGQQALRPNRGIRQGDNSGYKRIPKLLDSPRYF